MLVAFAQSLCWSATDELGAVDVAWWSGDYASGAWGGLRDRCAEHGFEVNLEYTGDFLANVSGGLQRGGAYLHLIQFGLDWDPQAVVPGWGGASFRASGIQAHQTVSMTLDRVGDLNGVDNIEAPNGFRLYEVWYRQRLAEGRFGFQLGNLLVDEDFAFNQLAGTLINGGFGWSQFVAANTGTLVPAYPFAALGVRLEWHPSARTTFQAGAYDGDAVDHVAGALVNNPDGTRFHLHSDQGIFAIAEFGYRLNGLEDDAGLPGAYKVGGFYQSSTFDDLYYDENGLSWIVSGEAPKTYAGSYMLYAAGEQMLWRESGEQGLGAFLRVGAGPDDRNPVNLVVDGGLQYRGLLPGREEDALTFGFIYAGLSEDLRRHERDHREIDPSAVAALSDYEWVFELTYQAHLNPWWYVQPDCQCIVHPGGSAANPTAWVVGVRTGLVF